MVVAVWLLGVGTLKDLALVMLVGIIVGAYASIFFATPLLVTLRERTELVRTHTRRVLSRRNGPDRGRRRRQGVGHPTSRETAEEPVAALAGKPAPGARRDPRRLPARAGRPSGKRNTRRR